MEKEGRRDYRYINGYNPVCTLSALLRTRNFLQVLTISPRICRACRPTPCPHSACKRNAVGVRLPKLGGAGGPPRSFARGRAKPRSASAPGERVRCAPRLSLWCSAGCTGSARCAGRPSHSRRAQARLLALGLRQMRGGGTHRAKELNDLAGSGRCAPRYSQPRGSLYRGEPGRRLSRFRKPSVT